MVLKVIVEATKGQTKRFEKTNNQSQLELLTDKEPKWLANYGFIADTLQADGDELDAFILGDPINVGEIVEAKPVAMILFNDEGKTDNKLVCTTKPYNRILLFITLLRLVWRIKRTKNKAKVIGVTKDPAKIEHEVMLAQALHKVLKGGSK